MKILLIITILISGALNLSGQINPMDKLFKDKPRDLKLYLNPTFEYSQIALTASKIAGIGAGVIINKKLSVGVSGNYVLNNISLPVTNGGGKLKVAMGGLHLEYTLWPLQNIHLSFPLSAGIGQLKSTGATTAVSTGSANFLFAEPGMMIEANIRRYVKLGIGTSYRYTANVKYSNLTSDDLNGFAAVVSLKFGNFRYSRH